MLKLHLSYNIYVREIETMITREGRFVFDYDTVDNCFDDLINVEIGTMFVSKDAMEKISDLLHLEDATTEEELRAIRNAVVVRISALEKKMANLDEDGNEIPGKKVNYDEMMKYSNKISGITAVIDDVLWRKGFNV